METAVCESVIERVQSTETLGSVDFLIEGIGELSYQEASASMTAQRELELQGQLAPEPLLVEDKSRFVLFPIKHTDVSSDTFIKHKKKHGSLGTENGPLNTLLNPLPPSFTLL